MIRVLIVNEMRLLANIITSVLQDEDDIEVVGCSHSFDEAVELINSHQIDVVLLSMKMRKENALVLTKKLDNVSSESNLVVYGMPEEKNRILPFIEAGADGIVKADDSADKLAKTIRLAYNGKAKFSPEITRSLIDRISHLSNHTNHFGNDALPTDNLTDRELEVLECLGKDMSNKEIAKSLFIEVGTVKNHVHHILEKLDVNTRGEASEYLMFTKNLSA